MMQDFGVIGSKINALCLWKLFFKRGLKITEEAFLS